MPAGLHVNSDSMHTQGANTVRNSEELGSEISKLKSNIASLMEIWRGLAASKFQDETDEQIVNLNSFQDLLETLGTKIESGARHFDDTEQSNAQAASNLF